MYAILCGAASDAIDLILLHREAKAAYILQSALLQAVEIYRSKNPPPITLL